MAFLSMLGVQGRSSLKVLAMDEKDQTLSSGSSLPVITPRVTIQRNRDLEGRGFEKRLLIRLISFYGTSQ